MIKIRVLGIEKGEYTSEYFLDSEELFGDEYQFHDDIEVEALLNVSENRYELSLDFYGQLKLTCDISAEQYLEDIEGKLKMHFKITSEGLQFTGEDESDRVEMIDNYIDITELVKQEMVLQVPLKRVSPKYRDKDFSEIHPEYTQSNEEEKKENPAFSKLKKLNFN